MLFFYYHGCRPRPGRGERHYGCRRPCTRKYAIVAYGPTPPITFANIRRIFAEKNSACRLQAGARCRRQIFDANIQKNTFMSLVLMNFNETNKVIKIFIDFNDLKGLYGLKCFVYCCSKFFTVGYPRPFITCRHVIEIPFCGSLNLLKHNR